MVIAPYIFQRCVVCRSRFKFGIRPPTWWILGFSNGSGDFRIGPPGVGLCGCHPARPLTMPESEALLSNPVYSSWLARGRALAWSLGRVLTPKPKYYRRPGEPRPPAKRSTRKYFGRRQSWMNGPVYITTTPPLPRR